MKCLFLTSTTDDYLASCAYDGLQEILGESNVYDAINNPGLHAPCPENPCSRIGASRIGNVLSDGDGDFDVFVINACFLRQNEWSLARKLLERLRPGAKIAFIEGWDSYLQIETPPFHVDAYFRRELDILTKYPYPAKCLTMAFPRRWFTQTDDRPLDVFYACNALSHLARWQVLESMWKTKKQHRSISASCAVASDMKTYFGYLSTHKLAICPTGAGECMDCLRTWEVVANGAIPIFVGLPRRTIEPWFSYHNEVFAIPSAMYLPDIIDKALGMSNTELKDMRDEMQATALAYHTTYARAKRLLDLTGV